MEGKTIKGLKEWFGHLNTLFVISLLCGAANPARKHTAANTQPEHCTAIPRGVVVTVVCKFHKQTVAGFSRGLATVAADCTGVNDPQGMSAML